MALSFKAVELHWNENNRILDVLLDLGHIVLTCSKVSSLKFLQYLFCVCSCLKVCRPIVKNPKGKKWSKQASGWIWGLLVTNIPKKTDNHQTTIHFCGWIWRLFRKDDHHFVWKCLMLTAVPQGWIDAPGDTKATLNYTTQKRYGPSRKIFWKNMWTIQFHTLPTTMSATFSAQWLSHKIQQTLKESTMNAGLMSQIKLDNDFINSLESALLLHAVCVFIKIS